MFDGKIRLFVKDSTPHLHSTLPSLDASVGFVHKALGCRVTCRRVFATLVWAGLGISPRRNVLSSGFRAKMWARRTQSCGIALTSRRPFSGSRERPEVKILQNLILFLFLRIEMMICLGFSLQSLHRVRFSLLICFCDFVLKFV